MLIHKLEKLKTLEDVRIKKDSLARAQRNGETIRKHRFHARVVWKVGERKEGNSFIVSKEHKCICLLLFFVIPGVELRVLSMPGKPLPSYIPNPEMHMFCVDSKSLTTSLESKRLRDVSGSIPRKWLRKQNNIIK
jgi:hypothetical protein